MLQKIILSICITLLFLLNSFAQLTTFPWSGTYGGAGTNRTYTTTVSGVTMSATIVNSENVWQDASPRWFPTGSVVPGESCSGISATNQGLLLSTNWTTNATKTITTTITFSTPVQGPVNFFLYDINDDGFGSWADRIIVTGTNSVAAPVNVFKVGTACVQTGGTVTGSGTNTLTFNSGNSSSCTCWGNNEVNVGTSSDCISTVTIQYRSANTTYNNPKQYVVISNLQATILAPLTPPSAITGNTGICSGQSTTLTAVGGSATSQWYTGSCGGTLIGTGASISVSPVSNTTYYVANVGPCNTMSTCATQTVTVSAPPTSPTAGTITQPTCLAPTGSVQLNGLPASGSWTITANPGGATLNGSGTSALFSGLSPSTNYTFTVSSSGCVSPSSSSVAINAIPGLPTAPIIGSITQPTCSVSTGSVTINGLPSSGSWDLTMNPGNVVTNGSGSSILIPNLTAGTYTFTVTNDLGCSSTTSANAVVNSQPVTPTAPIVGSITQPTCSVSTGSVSLSGLPSGTWTITASPDGQTLNSSGTTASFSGLSTGTYSFTVTNSDACTSAASASAVINTQPASPATPIVGTINQPTCVSPTGSVQLSGLPASGTWTVTANPGGLMTTSSGTTTNFNGLAAGTDYSFTVTNDQGCTSPISTSATINAVPGLPTTPIIGSITQPTCSVSTGSVTINGLPSSGSWDLTMNPGNVLTNGSGSSILIPNLTAGTYTFTVTNDLGCSSTTSANAVVNSQPVTPIAPIVGSITQPTCSVSTGSVSLSGLPSGTWTITASPGGQTLNASGTTADFLGLSAGTYSFTVTNSEACTSAASASAVITTQPASPTTPIIGTITQPSCVSPTGSVQLSGLPASGTWEIESIPGGLILTNSGTSATFNGLAAGTDYSFTVTNDQGCTSSISTIASINSVPGAPGQAVIGSVDQPTCAVPTGSFTISSPVGGNYEYSVNGGSFQIDPTFSGLVPGDYTITVFDNVSGCSTVSSLPVTINVISGAPVVTLVQSNSVVCFGDSNGSITISVTGGLAPYTYSWSPNAGNSDMIENLVTGSYTVEVLDDSGCSTTATFDVGSPAEMNVNGISSNVICGISEGAITTAVSGGVSPYDYLWSPSSETTSSISGLATGNYSVLVTDDNGCTATESFVVGTTGSLSVTVDPNYALIDLGTGVQLNASGGTTYSWTPVAGLSCVDCSDPIASPSTSTVYYVSSVDGNGCSGTDTVFVQIKLSCGDLFVPTIFSPNEVGPDANNKLCVYGTQSCIEELLFQVYDRWGEKVFETTDITKCWDGTYRGKLMNSGIFVYRLYVKLYNQTEEINISGNTTLVR
jgi:gliding motility-associated-like protein